MRAGARAFRERLAFKLWRWTMAGAGRFEFFGWLARTTLRALYALGLQGTALDPARPWTRSHAAPEIPRASFRKLWRERKGC